MVGIDEFKNIELKVARVISVEPHPNAEKLLVIKCSVGDEERQLVAGLQGHYTAEDLVGKDIIIVANLRPAVLRGVESQGMLLAAEDGEQIVHLTTERPVSPGSPIM